MKKRTSYYCEAFKKMWILVCVLCCSGIMSRLLGDRNEFLMIFCAVLFFGCCICTPFMLSKWSITAFDFYDNKFRIRSKYSEGWGSFKSSQFQIVTLSLPRILCLKTQNQTKIYECDLKGWSDLKIKQILSEFEKRGKKIEIDESLYNIF